MQGLELSKGFYNEHGKALTDSLDDGIKEKLCIGLFGSGSECYGFDDDVSKDHDFEPGFCIFIPDESVLDRKTAFMLERAYAKLPKEYMGFKRSMMSPVGGNRHGVIRTGEFFEKAVGSKNGKLSLEQWLRIPSYALCEAVNGEIFFDSYGEVTSIREYLRHMPEDVKKKRLAGNLLIMAQSGQYNYNRCLRHGENAAAQLAAVEFVKAVMEVVFLLNDRYMPYYKWSFKAMRELDILSITAHTCEFLLTTTNEGDMADEKYFMIEDTATSVIEELMNQGLTKANCGDLEKHAYSVNDGIGDSQIRNLNILYTV